MLARSKTRTCDRPVKGTCFTQHRYHVSIIYAVLLSTRNVANSTKFRLNCILPYAYRTHTLFSPIVRTVYAYVNPEENVRSQLGFVDVGYSAFVSHSLVPGSIITYRTTPCTNAAYSRRNKLTSNNTRNMENSTFRLQQKYA